MKANSSLTSYTKNIKDTKQQQKNFEEAMESENFDNDSDSNENTMLE